MTKNIIILLLAVCGGAAGTITYQYVMDEPDITAQNSSSPQSTTTQGNQTKQAQQKTNTVTVVAQIPVDDDVLCTYKNGCLKAKHHKRLNTDRSPRRF